MTAPRDPDAILDMWLEEGPTRLPEVTRRAIVVTTRTTHQTRHPMRVPWRFRPMHGAVRYAVAAAAVLAVAVGGLVVLNPGPNGGVVGGVATPTPRTTPTAAPAVEPTASPSSSPLPSLDTKSWVEYTSARYGFVVGHPADWTVRPAVHDWTFKADAADWLSTGQEAFVSPGSTIRVSVWSVALDHGTTVSTWADAEAWVAQYCQKEGNSPCAGIHDRAVPLCNERRDCHPAVLVPFGNDVQAFFTGGNYGDRMVVVAVWWGEAAPAVAPYGGSTRLLEAFLSTMNVWPSTGPDNHP